MRGHVGAVRPHYARLGAVESLISYFRDEVPLDVKRHELEVQADQGTGGCSSKDKLASSRTLTLRWNSANALSLVYRQVPTLVTTTLHVNCTYLHMVQLQDG